MSYGRTRVKQFTILPLSIHYLYNTNYVCVCVCLSSIGGQTAGSIMTKFGTYMRIDMGVVPAKKKVPRMVRKGGLIGAILRSRYLAGGQRAIRAVTASR